MSSDLPRSTLLIHVIRLHATPISKLCVCGSEIGKRLDKKYLTEGLAGRVFTFESGSDRKHDLVDLHTCRQAIWLSVGSAHSCHSRVSMRPAENSAQYCSAEQRGMKQMWTRRPQRRLTCLQTIRTSACEHFVDTDDVEGVKSHADVEVILANGVDHVLVGCDTSRFERLRGNLLLLKGEKVHTRGEGVYRKLFLANIEDLDLGLRHTAAVA